MKEGYTSDCYICTMDNFDVICDTLINRGCNILNAVPTDYYINGAYINATRMCITYERPNTPAGKEKRDNSCTATGPQKGQVGSAFFITIIQKR